MNTDTQNKNPRRNRFGNLVVILFTLVVLFATANNARAADISTGLVGHWTFDSTDTNWTASTTADSSGDSYTGSLVNFYSATSTVSGQIKEALNFNGSSSYVNVGDQTNLKITSGDITISAWINTPNPTKSNMMIVTKSSASGDGYELRFNSSTGIINFFGGSGSKVIGVTTIQSNRWYHVVAVRQGSTGYIYINDILDATSTISNFNSSTYSFEIGKRGAETNWYYQGIIDDVRVYSRALSASDIDELYRESFPLAASPSTISFNTTGNAVTLTGSNVSWTPGTPGSPTFSISGVSGVSIASQSVSDSNHATININTGNATGTAIITDPSTNATTSITIGHLYYTDPVTDPKIYFSPYNWYSDGNGSLGGNNIKGNSTYAISVNPGAYLKTNFTGTSVGVAVDSSNLGGCTKTCPRIRYSIDNGASQDYQLKTTDATVTLAQNLAVGTHSLQLWFLSADYISRWTQHYSALKITGLVLDQQATTSAPTVLSKNVLAFGDSITEGAWVLGDHTDTTNYSDYQQSVSSYMFGLATSSLNAEYGQVAFGGQQLEGSPTGIDIPSLVNGWNYYLPSYSRLFGGLLSPAPDYLFVNIGTNAGATTTTVTSWLTSLRAAIGSQAKLFVIVPFNQNAVANITAGFNTYVTNSSDTNAFLVNLGSNGVTYSTTVPTYSYDGLHPNVIGHVQLQSLIYTNIQNDIQSPPSVLQASVSSITAIGATASSTIIATGGSNATTRGFAYSTDSNLVTSVSTTTESGSFVTGAFSTSLSSLTCGTAYYVRSYATNSAGTTYGASQSFTTSACTVPDAPTGVSASAGNGQATISFTAPSNGGSAITGYTVTSNPGNITASGASSPITVTGLTNGTSYTFTVTATNAIGTSSASSVSNAVTPSAPVVGNGPVASSGSSGGSTPAARQAFLRSLYAANGLPCPVSVCPVQTLSGSNVPSASYNFTRILKLGSSGDDVKQLQIFLNNQGFTIASSGAGSPGHETTYFGPATKAALIKFQNAHIADILTPVGLSSGTGIFGPSTIRYIDSLGSGSAQTTTTATTTNVGLITPNSQPFQFTRTLQVGSTGDDIRQLQIFLNSQGFTVAPSGAGSPGHETTYFGPATKAALAKFQAASDISPAVGYFGPITMKTVNIMIK